ncbi:MAG: glycosyltransferase family 39 protein [Bacteroidetes bacterium]|nr:glycosyltransferase family 39 protein [Bacteroidota bacterium]
MRRYGEYILVLALLIPLLFLNTRNSHDWGDDFAQYIHQAQNISKGVSQNETGYVFNPGAFLGPQAYPPGFPLLLAPVVSAWGVDYAAMEVYLSAFLMLACFTGFLILRHFYSFSTAFITTLIIAYNPVTISFKTEILSDIPFMFFSMLALWLAMKKPHWLYAAGTGLILGFASQIRSIAVVLMLAVLLQQILTLKREDRLSFQSLRLPAILLVSFLLCYFGIQWIWPANSAYPQFFDTNTPYQTAVIHLSSHNESLHKFFRDYDVKDYFFINCIAASCLTAFGLLGFCRSLAVHKASLFNLYVLGYLIIIVSYKFGDTGLRFVFPLLFLIFFYAILGLKMAFSGWILKPSGLSFLFGFFILFSYYEPLANMHAQRHAIADGPCTPEATALFKFIQSQVPPSSVIAFDKPRALSLYTGRSGMCPDNTLVGERLLDQLHAFHCSYILTKENLSSASRISEIQADTLHYKSVYRKGGFELSKLYH